MRSFTSLVLALSAAVGTLAFPSDMSKRQDVLTDSATGDHDGFYYSFWTDGGPDVSFTLESGGSYSVEWSGSGNWVGGKGWNPGAERTISYTADYNPNGNSYLAVYGWTTDPLVEYYVVESFGTYNPASDSEQVGSVESDGSTYDVYQSIRENAPSIEGTATFPQFWSIRADQRTSGLVNMGNHFNAWTEGGLQLGTHNYQIVATEGYDSSGSASVTVEG